MKLIISISLFLTASLLKLIVEKIFFVYGFFRALLKKELSKYLLDLSISQDQYGNAIGKYIFSDSLIKVNGYKFGNIDETISSVLGKNKKSNTLTGLGLFIDSILNFFEKNHSIKSIDETEGNN